MKRDRAGISTDGVLADAVPADGALADRMTSRSAGDAFAAALTLLDSEETEYFTLNVIQGKPRGKCQQILGWSDSKIHRVRMRLNLHLRQLRAGPLPDLPAISDRHNSGVSDGSNLERKRGAGGYRCTTPARIYSFARGSSLNPFYRERLPSGLSTWSLSPSIERKFITQLPVIEGPMLKGKPMRLTPEEQLASGEKALQQMGEELHRIHAEGAKIDRLIAEVFDAKQKLEPSDTIVAATYTRRIVELRAERKSNQSAYDAARAQMRSQADEVDRIKNELKAQTKAKKLEAVAPLVARFIELQNESAMLAEAIRQGVRGENVFCDEVIKTREHDDTRRARFANLFFHEAQFLGQLVMYSPRLRGELFRKYPTSMPETWKIDAA